MNSKTFVPSLKSFLDPRAYFWTSTWDPGSTGFPHILTFQKMTPSGVTVVEMEAGNADVVVGIHASGRQAFDCDLLVYPPRGFEIVYDCYRDWPHRWFPMHSAVRRYAFYPKDKPYLRPEAERLVAGVYERRWRRGRLAYGPCNLPLPDLTSQQRAQEATKISGWLGHLRSLLGSPTGMTGGIEDSEDGLLTSPVYGWRPWGVAANYAYGGSGIYFYTGWEQVPDMPAYLWLVASSNHERRWHAYHRANGEIVTADDYGDPGPMYQGGTGDPNNGWLPEFLGVAQNPDPIILPYNEAHCIRGFRHLLALSEMCDSPMVKRMLRGQAAQFRLQYSEIGPLPQSSGYTPPSLRNDRNWIAARKNQGMFGQDNGRRYGWRAVLIAQSVKRAGAYENVRWCQEFARLVCDAVMPNGIFSRCHEPAGGDPVWYDPNHDTAQSFEVPILWHGAYGSKIQGSANLPVESWIQRAAKSLYEDAPLLPYYNGQGPPHFAYVARRGGTPYPSVPGGKIDKGGDTTHVHAGCALAAKADPQYRTRWIYAGKRIMPVHDMRESAGLVAQEQLA